MTFPLFVFAPERRQEFFVFRSLDEAQLELDPVDVDSAEIFAGDATGAPIRLGAQNPVWLTLEPEKSSRMTLAEALHAQANRLGVSIEPPTSNNFEKIAEALLKKEKRPWNIF